jgi:uncharacterized RDD family membrane protein YckC
MDQWRYQHEGEIKGPVSSAELLNLMESGIIHPQALVRAGGQGPWLEAAEAQAQIQQYIQDLGSHTTNTQNTPFKARYQAHAGAPKPWVRYFARGFDGMLWLFLMAFLAAFTITVLIPTEISVITQLPSALLSLFYVGFSILCETIAFALSGSTPGKALFNIKVRRTDGSAINFLEALFRASRVHFYGTALSIFPLSLIAMAIAFFRLKTNGMTSWDHKGHFTVEHGELNPIRVAIGIGLPIIVIFSILQFAANSGL